MNIWYKTIDRDIYAAQNLKQFALLNQNAGQELPGEPVEIKSDILESKNALICEAGSSSLKNS